MKKPYFDIHRNARVTAHQRQRDALFLTAGFTWLAEWSASGTGPQPHLDAPFLSRPLSGSESGRAEAPNTSQR